MNDVEPSTRRVFFALLPDQNTHHALAQAIAPIIKANHPRLRWLSSESWHLTLRFVGNVTNHQLEGLTECVEQIAGNHSQVDLNLLQIEPFPSRRRPVVLAATGDSTPSACLLVAGLEHACRDLGLPAEHRGWRCHLTLARVRGRSAIDIGSTTLNVALRSRELLLMETVVQDRQSQYVPVARGFLNE